MNKVKTLEKGAIGYLNDLKIGQIGKVVEIDIKEKEIRRHLLDMGITKGAIIKIKKIASMGDPVDIELRGYELCIRKKEMKNIKIEVM